MVRQRFQGLRGELLIRLIELLDDRVDLHAQVLRPRADREQQFIGWAALQVGQLQQLGHRQLNETSLKARHSFARNLQVLADLRLGQLSGTTIPLQLETNVMWARLIDWQWGALRFDPYGRTALQRYERLKRLTNNLSGRNAKIKMDDSTVTTEATTFTKPTRVRQMR